ncbi:MAG: ATP-binding protein [Miltoncostaeaceae bacterium]
MADASDTGSRVNTAARLALLEAIRAVGEASDDGLSGADGLDAGIESFVGGLGLALGAVYVKRPTTGAMELRAWRGDHAPEAKRLELAAHPELYEELLGGEARALDALSARETLGTDVGAMAPMRAGAETLGAVLVAPPADGEIEPGAIEALAGLARVLGLALSNAQLFRGLQDRAREMDRQVRQLFALTEVARAVARWLDPTEVQDTVVSEARRLVRAEGAALALADEAGLAVVARDTAEAGAQTPLAVAQAMLAADQPLRTEAGVASLAVEVGEGRRGALLVWRSTERPFEENDSELLSGLADQATVALTNARLLTDLEHEQRAHRHLAGRIVEAQELERRRIAEDIHDGPVQQLVGLGLLLDALAAEGDDDPESTRKAATAARETVRGLREVIFDLHPMSLEELRFTAATRTVCERHAWRGFACELDLAPADTLDDTQRTVAFRVVQEAITNAAKHANAQRLSVSAREEGADVVIEIVDDGAGFDSEILSESRIDEGHLGLAAMRERARLAGGSLDIETAPGEGTTVRLTVPGPAGGV